jgi:hypothetical protein
MREHGNQAMGPRNALGGKGWVEVCLPYSENRNEEELELDTDYNGPMPSWEIWDWLEASIPDMHDEINGSVAWWRTGNLFTFFFREKRDAVKFALRFNGRYYDLGRNR